MPVVTLPDDVQVNLIIQQPVNPVQEVMEYSTDIMQSINASESRVPLRANPRVSVQYKYPVKLMEQQALYNMLYSQIRKTFALPLWYDVFKTTGTLTPGATELTASFIPNSLKSTDMMLLYSSSTTWQLVKISAINTEDKTITFADATTIGWASGSFVIPVIMAWISGNVRKSGSAHDAMYEMEFDIINAMVVEEAVPPTYNSIDLYTTEGLLDGTSVSRTLEAEVDAIDFEIGKRFKRTQWKNSRYSYDHRAVFETISELDAFRKRFARHSGRYRTFYQPSLDVNLRIKAVSGVTIDIYPDDYGYFQNHKTIAVKRLSTGAWVLREITGATAIDSTTTRLTLDSALGVALSDIYYCSYLALCRLDSDTLEINHIGNNVSEATIRIVEISPN